MIEGLNPYPEYQPSSIAWLAPFPAHWKMLRGKNLFRESTLPVRGDDGVVTCFRDGQVTLRVNRRTTGFTNAILEGGYQGVRRGQLVIHAMDAFAGAVGVSDSDGKCTPEYAVCDPVSDANPYYYARLLREAARQGYILIECPAVRERAPRFRYPSFGAMRFPVPPPAEQAAIVKFIDHVDRKIRRYVRAKQKLIKLLEEQKQAIIHQAVTRGLDPNVRLKASGVEWLGDVPEHWQIRRLKTLFKEVDTRSTSGDEGLLSLRMHEGLVPHAAVSDKPIGAENLVGYKRVAPNQLVMNRMRAAIGIFGVPRQRGLVSPDYAIFAPAAGVNPWYFLRLFKTQQACDAFRLESRGLGTGSSGFMRLYTDRFGRIEVTVPPEDEQQRIVDRTAQRCGGEEAGIQRLKTEVALVKEYRTRLISDVVTGKLDVRGAAAALPDEEGDMEDADEPDLEGADDDLEDDADLSDEDAAE